MKLNRFCLCRVSIISLRQIELPDGTLDERVDVIRDPAVIRAYLENREKLGLDLCVHTVLYGSLLYLRLAGRHPPPLQSGTKLKSRNRKRLHRRNSRKATKMYVLVARCEMHVSF